MKVTLSLLFITLTTFSGRPGIVAQQPLPEKYKVIVLPVKIANDSLEVNYFNEIKRTEKLTDQLIARKKDVDNENTILKAEIKRLRKINDYLRQNIDTVFIHDTVFKRRKLLQLFKN